MRDSEFARAGLDRLLEREIHELVRKIFRFRFSISFVQVLLFIAFLIWDPVPWKLLWIGAFTVLLHTFFFIEYWRIRSKAIGARTIQLDFAVMLAAQSAMIYITGGIESPVLVIYLLIVLGAGLILGDFVKALPVTLVAIGFTVLFSAGCLYGWIPRSVPAFFDLGEGLCDKPVYIWTTAGVMTVIILMVSAFSIVVRTALDREIRRNLLAREEALKSLVGRNREVLDISRTIAHELKNPLASIKGLAQLLSRSTELGTKGSERLGVIRKEIERMSEVLDRFRDLTHPLSNLNEENFDLSVLLGDAVRLQEGIAAKRNISLTFDALTSIPIICDGQKIRQATVNLLQNALEATPPGGNVAVRLTAVDNGGARVEIQDSGVGLSEEAERLMFVSGFTTKAKGTGIGLTVARAIIEQHGGTLKLENVAAGGCRAIYELVP
jgi:signal transduction histidine kinase